MPFTQYRRPPRQYHVLFASQTRKIWFRGVTLIDQLPDMNQPIGALKRITWNTWCDVGVRIDARKQTNDQIGLELNK